VQQRHVDAALDKTIRRLDAEQAAADHHGPASRLGGPQGVHIGEVAEGADARQRVTGNRQADGVGAGRQHQPVVAETHPACEYHLALGGPDL
jgi:hypothetical protein